MLFLVQFLVVVAVPSNCDCLFFTKIKTIPRTLPEKRFDDLPIFIALSKVFESSLPYSVYSFILECLKSTAITTKCNFGLTFEPQSFSRHKRVFLFPQKLRVTLPGIHFNCSFAQLIDFAKINNQK